MKGSILNTNHSQDPHISLMLAHLSINDENQRAGAPENHLVIECRVEKVHLPRKVPYVKVHKGTARDVVLADLVGALQEERLIRGHLMKHHLRSTILNHR